MFAVDHAATALLVKRRYPSARLAPILVSVQAMELAWVALNYLGVERTTTDATVHSVADIHLAYMPYSHSVGTAIGVAVLAWLLIEKGFGRAALGRAVGVGIASHLILDLATHGHDIVLWPGLSAPRLGLGLYEAAPVAAFIVEFIYGIVCWYVYRGGLGLLAVIGLGNLANLSFLSPAIPGPEEYLAGRPMLLVTVIFVQIVVMLVLVGILARKDPASTARRDRLNVEGGSGAETRIHAAPFLISQGASMAIVSATTSVAAAVRPCKVISLDGSRRETTVTMQIRRAPFRCL